MICKMTRKTTRRMIRNKPEFKGLMIKIHRIEIFLLSRYQIGIERLSLK